MRGLDLGHTETISGAQPRFPHVQRWAVGHLWVKNLRCLCAAVLVRAPRRACGDGEEKAKGVQAELQTVSLAAGWQPTSGAGLALPCPRVAGSGGASISSLRAAGAAECRA